ncbi:MAG: hypothetical protein ACK43N_01615, partial [Pirellulaceae bacterium]
MAWLIPLLLLFAGCRPADKKPASGPSAASAAASVRQAETPSSEVTDRTPFRIRFADRSADSGIQVRYN